MQKIAALPFWKEIPFVRILLPFVLGIYIQHSFILHSTLLYTSLGMFCSFLFLFFLFPLRVRYRWRYMQGLWLQVFLITIGCWITSGHQQSSRPEWIGHWDSSGILFKTELLEPPVEKEKTFKVLVKATETIEGAYSKPATGYMICYLQKDSSCSSFSVGDWLYFKKDISLIRSAGNPGSFDYARYAALQQCFHQTYLPAGSFLLVTNNQKNRFREWLENSRKRIVSILKKYIPGAKECGLAEALLIGYKDDLDKSLVQSYANTGVVHIIAISGLHLGLIYWLLASLLQPLKHLRHFKWIRPAGIIAGLWIFTFLAGASPSVLRSAVMFSCLVTGEIANKKTSGINNLLASAFLLLCYDPEWLWDTGFQLSYSAVLSLLLFMKPVYEWIVFKNKWLDLLWKMNAVTIAAQVLTLPLCLFYFHQFPNAFLITNLVAVPLSSLILFVELALCLLAAWPLVAVPLGKILQWLLHLMNSFVEYFSRLPYAVMNDINISSFQTGLFYLIILALSIWLMNKKPKAFIATLFLILLFCTDQLRIQLDTSQQRILVVFNIQKVTAAAIVTGQHFWVKGVFPTMEDSVYSSRILHSGQLYFHAMETQYDPSISKARYIQTGATRILFLELDEWITTTGSKPVVDILIVSRDPEMPPETFLEQAVCKKIVLDASNKRWTLLRWTEAALKAGIPCYSLVDKGAFVINLP